jgi:hypothetical protein
MVLAAARGAQARPHRTPLKCVRLPHVLYVTRDVLVLSTRGFVGLRQCHIELCRAAHFTNSYEACLLLAMMFILKCLPQRPSATSDAGSTHGDNSSKRGPRRCQLCDIVGCKGAVNRQWCPSAAKPRPETPEERGSPNAAQKKRRLCRVCNSYGCKGKVNRAWCTAAERPSSVASGASTPALTENESAPQPLRKARMCRACKSPGCLDYARGEPCTAAEQETATLPGVETASRPRKNKRICRICNSPGCKGAFNKVWCQSAINDGPDEALLSAKTSETIEPAPGQSQDAASVNDGLPDTPLLSTPIPCPDEPGAAPNGPEPIPSGGRPSAPQAAHDSASGHLEPTVAAEMACKQECDVGPSAPESDAALTREPDGPLSDGPLSEPVDISSQSALAPAAAARCLPIKAAPRLQAGCQKDVPQDPLPSGQKRKATGRREVIDMDLFAALNGAAADGSLSATDERRTRSKVADELVQSQRPVRRGRASSSENGQVRWVVSLETR